MFEGQIRIESVELTTEPMAIVHFDSGKGYGSVTYFHDGNGAKFIGYIRMDRKGREFIKVIVYPEKPFEEFGPFL